MSKENQSSLLWTAETLKKELTQREGYMVLKVSSGTDKQTNCWTIEEKANVREGNCRIWRFITQR